jgi:hypothetical protein
MNRMDLARGDAARAHATAPERLAVRHSAAVIGATSLVLWAALIWLIA